MEQLKALQHIFNQDRKKSENGAETIQLIKKVLKRAKTAIK